MPKRWSSLSPSKRLIVLLATAMVAAAAIITPRSDLARRDPDAIRGDPKVWNRVTRSPGGAVAYLLTGGRRVNRPV